MNFENDINYKLIKFVIFNKLKKLASIEISRLGQITQKLEIFMRYFIDKSKWDVIERIDARLAILSVKNAHKFVL